MNVVPRSTNQGTRELQEAKKNYLWPQWESNPVGKLSRQSNGRSNKEVVGSIPTKVKKNFFLCLKWFPDSPY